MISHVFEWVRFFKSLLLRFRYFLHGNAHPFLYQAFSRKVCSVIQGSSLMYVKPVSMSHFLFMDITD
ncbi:hypothetical protein V3C99_007951 [Haemonchus contortus]